MVRFSVDSYRSLAISVAIVAPAISGLFVFVEKTENWYLAQLAALAPLVAWLSVAGRPWETATQTTLVLLFATVGIFLGFVSLEISGLLLEGKSRKFLAILLNIPGVFGISCVKLPRSCGLGQTLATLLAATLGIYGRNNEISDRTRPLKAGAAVAGGAVVTLLVTSVATWKFLDKRKALKAETAQFEASADAALGGLVDFAVSGGRTRIMKNLDACNADALLLPTSGCMQQTAVTLVDALQAAETLLTQSAFPGDFSLAPEISAALVRAKTDVEEEKAAADLSGVLASTGVRELRLECGLKQLVRALRLRRRFAAIRDYRSQHSGLLSGLARLAKLATRESRKSWIGKNEFFLWGAAARNSLVVALLSVSVVFWDVASPAVDASALWGLLPALLMLFPVRRAAAETVVHGAQVFLGSLVGGGLGVVSVVASGNSRAAYVSQFLLMLVVSGNFRNFSDKFPCPAAMLFTAWTICGLSEWREAAQASEISGRSEIWRAALYRVVIVHLALALALAAAVAAPSQRRSCSDTRKFVQSEICALVEDALTLETSAVGAGGGAAGSTSENFPEISESLARTLSFMTPPSTPGSGGKSGNSQKFPITQRVELARLLRKAEAASAGNFRLPRSFRGGRTPQEFPTEEAAALLAAGGAALATATYGNFTELRRKFSEIFRDTRGNPRAAILELANELRLLQEISDQRTAVGNFLVLLHFCKLRADAF